MDEKTQAVEKKVRELYESKLPGRDEWTDWLWTNHVLWVADKAVELAKRKDADASLCRVAALLHDIADAEMQRENENHESRSLEIARDFLASAGYSEETIDSIVNDALAKHSCWEGNVPESLVGKVLATADGLAHFQSDFLIYASANVEQKTYEQRKRWCLEKIERDYRDKLLFEDIREETRPFYEVLKTIFST